MRIVRYLPNVMNRWGPTVLSMDFCGRLGTLATLDPYLSNGRLLLISRACSALIVYSDGRSSRGSSPTSAIHNSRAGSPRRTGDGTKLRINDKLPFSACGRTLHDQSSQSIYAIARRLLVGPPGLRSIADVASKE